MNLQDEVRKQLTEYLLEDVEVGVSGPRTSVLTPSEYPDGDGVVVYLVEEGGSLWVTDLGDALSAIHGQAKLKHFRKVASTIAAEMGLRFNGTGFLVPASSGRLGEACLRVGQAAARAADLTTFKASSGDSKPKDDFPDVLGEALADRGLKVERDHKLIGDSGHTHKALFFEPERELVIENVSGSNPWNKAVAVLASFTDLAQVNGYRCLAILDDRQGEDLDQERSLVTNAGGVLAFSDRASWEIGSE